MSKLLNFTGTATIGPVTGGFRLGGITLAAGTAAASAVLTEVFPVATGTATVAPTPTATFTRMQISSPASQTVPHSMTDWENGAYFDGVLVLSSLTGNGASVNIEEM